VPRDQALKFLGARLRVTWDGRATASIDCSHRPVFGAGTLYNRDNREYLVKSFPMVVRYSADRVYLSCYFPMPFFHSARVELIGTVAAVGDIEWKVRSAPYRDAANQVGYFHATYSRTNALPEPGKRSGVLDTTKTEGPAADWSGQFGRNLIIFSHAAVLNIARRRSALLLRMTSRTPQAQGTGTEEWGRRPGDYWGGENMTLSVRGGGPSYRREERHDGGERRRRDRVGLSLSCWRI